MTFAIPAGAFRDRARAGSGLPLVCRGARGLFGIGSKCHARIIREDDAAGIGPTERQTAPESPKLCPQVMRNAPPAPDGFSETRRD